MEERFVPEGGVGVLGNESRGDSFALADRTNVRSHPPVLPPAVIPGRLESSRGPGWVTAREQGTVKVKVTAKAKAPEPEGCGPAIEFSRNQPNSTSHRQHRDLEWRRPLTIQIGP